MAESDQEQAGQGRITLLQAVGPPLVFLLIVVAAFFLSRALNIPSGEQLQHSVIYAMDEYGYWLILVAAFFEAVLVLNFYLPGSAVVVLGVAASREGALNPVAIGAISSFGFMLAYIADYCLGRYAWSSLLRRSGFRRQLIVARRRANSEPGMSFYLWFVHPNLGAFLATGFGAIKAPPLAFFVRASAGTLVWTALWTIVAYTSADLIFTLTNMRYVAPIAIIWLMIAYVRFVRSDQAVSSDRIRP